MGEQPQTIVVFLDLLPNLPKNDQTRDNLRQIRSQTFEHTLADTVERVWDLPPMMVRPHGDYLALLIEARELYLTGLFYSCVAMCGIVGERLIKDVFRASVLVQTGRRPQPPSDDAFDQLERVDVSGILRFVRKAGLVGEKAAEDGDRLIGLRNQYAHARGKAPQLDALKAIKFLHTIVEDTVSVFRDLEIKDGAFVRKATP